MEQIPLPKHVSDRVEKRWATSRFCEKDAGADLIEAKLARLRTHRNNIHRYRRLLKTRLTEIERQFIERRLAEERTAMNSLVGETFPFALNLPRGVPDAGRQEKETGPGPT
jgi:hypothetical protein